ncbi:hypothetical protein AL073_06970 [Loktanella sp. 1ANDIMAR09]|nr:hypothetical protein AL073_06970 [Loktanella sp. 1ANDIMAR09]
MTIHRFKITDGCPETGHKIACNTTQAAAAFSTNLPSTEDRAKEGMKTHAAYRANEAGFRAAKEAEREAAKRGNQTHRQMLRPDQLK